jgi:hypothetical protein
MRQPNNLGGATTMKGWLTATGNDVAFDLGEPQFDLVEPGGSMPSLAVDLCEDFQRTRFDETVRTNEQYK